MKKLRLATVFSGIGAVEQALEKLNKKYEIVFACDNGEIELETSKNEIFEVVKGKSDEEANEIIKQIYRSTNKKNYVKESYFSNYDIDENRWYEDIRFIDGTKHKGKVDLFVGGSPCQSFSISGKRGGLDDARGTLFYEYARLVKEIEPKVFIYENVVGMVHHDKGKTWEVIRNIFDSLDYKIHYQIMNSKDYGIPQDRKRIFVVGFRNSVEFTFPKPKKLETTLFDYLEPHVATNHYLGKKGFEFVTNPKYKNRAGINNKIIKTQKANQQFNWNGDFVFEKLDFSKHNDNILDRAYVGEYNGYRGVIRQLSYRECLRLMGFSDSFKVVVPNVPAYRQIGNSIVVNVLESLITSIYEYYPDVEFDDRLCVATVFSGIGAFEFALKRLKIDHKIVFACDNGEVEIEYDIDEQKEIVFSLNGSTEKKKYVDNLYKNKTAKTNFVKQSYLANYDLDEDFYFRDINLLDGTDFEGKVDIFVGGSPCQSFSTVGQQCGLEDTRGTLFYEFARLVKEIKPKVFIYENVRGMLTHDKGNTWRVIKSVFEELGYDFKYELIDAKDHGVPQTRRRVIVVGIRQDLDRVTDFNMPDKKELTFTMQDFLIENVREGDFTHSDSGGILVDGNPGEIEEKYFLTPKLYKYVMSGGTKTFYTKPVIDLPVARTLLKTMGNRHRAGVDNYVTVDGRVRMLSEREAHRLMGFTDDYDIVVSRAQGYKQAGNSIVVDVLMDILIQLSRCVEDFSFSPK